MHAFETHSMRPPTPTTICLGSCNTLSCKALRAKHLQTLHMPASSGPHTKPPTAAAAARPMRHSTASPLSCVCVLCMCVSTSRVTQVEAHINTTISHLQHTLAARTHNTRTHKDHHCYTVAHQDQITPTPRTHTQAASQRHTQHAWARVRLDHPHYPFYSHANAVRVMELRCHTQLLSHIHTYTDCVGSHPRLCVC